MLERFKNIFAGLETSYGQTKMTGEIRDDGKNEAESITVHKPVTDMLWQKHLNGEFPALGIVPIRQDSRCKWGCLDVDVYDLDHKELITKIKNKNLPLIVFKSKSGGAHIFLFVKEFVPASLVREKLKTMAAMLGHAGKELFPKQDYILADKNQVGSWLNVPYHGGDNSVRRALGDDAGLLTLEEFFKLYDKKVLSEKDLIQWKEPITTDNDDLLEAPPCLVTLLSDKVPQGKRNDTMFNVGVYLRKRFPDQWKTKLHSYNSKYMNPPIDDNNLENTVIKSLLNKEYRYKCKQEPIRSFCESKICVKRKFGVGENVPTPEIERIEKYPSHPTIYIVYLDGKPVEVDRGTLHEFDKFSMEVMDQLNQVLMPIGKMVWKKLLHKIMSNKDTFKILEVPQAARLDYQLKELLGDFLNRATGKTMEDVKRGIPFTENGHSYFKYQSFNNFLKRSKSWDIPKAKTQRMLTEIFKAKEEVLKLDKKSMRIWKIETINVDKPTITENTMKEPAFK
jgi:hypothetical protein